MRIDRRWLAVLALIVVAAAPALASAQPATPVAPPPAKPGLALTAFPALSWSQLAADMSGHVVASGEVVGLGQADPNAPPRAPTPPPAVPPK